VQKIVQRALGSTFLRHNAIFFFGSLFVAFLNYLYYPIVGRLLSPADFGEVQAIISFYLQAGVFFQVFSLVIIGVIKKYENDSERNAVIAQLEQLAVLMGAVLFAAVIILSRPLENYLNFTSFVPFVLFAVSMLLGIPLIFSNAYLQGYKKFGILSVSNILSAGCKLLLSVGWVLAGLRSAGAILGLVMSQFVALMYSFWQARKLGRPPMRLAAGRPSLAFIRPELRYAGLVLVTSLCVNIILSIDIIAAKHYFDPVQAGLYAGIATVARIIFWLTGPLAAVLIASVKLSEPAHNRALLARSAAMLVALGGTTMLFFTLFPRLVLSILIGPRYLAYAGQLPRLSLAIFILSLANLLLYYHVALRRALVVPVALLGFFAMGILLAIQHQTIPAVVTSLVEGSAILLILVTVVSFSSYKEGRARS
jgi:O-antigen/teichoic acid export membrane protein